MMDTAGNVEHSNGFQNLVEHNKGLENEKEGGSGVHNTTHGTPLEAYSAESL